LILEDATEKVDAWPFHNNEERPHSSLGYKSTVENQALIQDKREPGLQMGQPPGGLVAGRVKNFKKPDFLIQFGPNKGASPDWWEGKFWEDERR
jgi:hypothetical protein